MLGRIPFLCQGRVKPCSRRWRSMAETVPLQEIFQIVVMVAVLTTEGDALALALPFPAHKAELAAVIRLDG